MLQMRGRCNRRDAPQVIPLRALALRHINALPNQYRRIRRCCPKDIRGFRKQSALRPLDVAWHWRNDVNRQSPGPASPQRLMQYG
jgi:hypothetical protein